MIDRCRENPKRTRVVPAPLPTDPSIPPSIHSIELEEGFDVEWHWLELPDGNKVVTRFQIVPSESYSR